MLFVPFCAFDDLPVFLLGHFANMGEPILVCYAIAVHILVGVGSESDYIFLTQNLQDAVDLIHLKSYALLMQSDSDLSNLVIEAIDTEIKVETVWL